MSILLAGNGNIGRALMSIFDHRGECPDIVVCDIRDGVDCIEYIKSHSDKIETVVNLTTAPTQKILAACAERDISYIDAGIESFPEELTVHEYYLEMMNREKNAKYLFGFGMNPGLIEYIYFKHAPKSPHIAVLFEFDDAAKGDRIFNTWSPLSYYNEAVKDYKFITTQENPMLIVPADSSVRLDVQGKSRRFLVIPHDETFSMCRVNKNCLSACFLYQAPERIQEYFQERGAAISESEIKSIETLHDIEGSDTVGVLYYEPGKPLRYAFNSACHQEKYALLKTNATCWQTACGIYTALKLLPHLDNGATTMSDVAVSHDAIISGILNELGFVIEETTGMVQLGEFEEKVLPLFPEAVRRF